MIKVGDSVIAKVNTAYLLKGDEYKVVQKCPNDRVIVAGYQYAYEISIFKLKESVVPEQQTKIPHKHAELIKAWADGAEIQFNKGDGWEDISRGSPGWFPHYEYRIKPQKVKRYAKLFWNGTSFHFGNVYDDYKSAEQQSFSGGSWKAIKVCEFEVEV